MGLYDQSHSPQYALEKLRIATARASAAQQIAQRNYHQAQAEADEWKRQYPLALTRYYSASSASLWFVFIQNSYIPSRFH